MLICCHWSASYWTLVIMDSINIRKVIADHISLHRGQFRILSSIIFWWHWKISLYQMERSSSNYFWFSFLLFNVNDLFHNFPIHIRNWNRHCDSFISNIHVLNYSQSGTIVNINQVEGILGFRMPLYIYFSVVRSLFSSLENPFIFNLCTWNLCLIWALKEWKVKFKILMGT